MIEKVELYETNDGKLFESITQAEEHIVNVACESLESILKPLTHCEDGKMLPILEHRTKIKVIEILVGDMDKLSYLVAVLSRLVE